MHAESNSEQTGVERALRGAVAGSAAATLWLACEPLLARLTGLNYTEVQLLGGLVADAGPTKLVGSAMHIANGAMFGSVFCLAGGEGVGTGVKAALAETAVAWPGFVVIDRIHPKRKRGEWPRLWSSPRVITHEVLGHVLFGAALGALMRPRDCLSITARAFNGPDPSRTPSTGRSGMSDRRANRRDSKQAR